MTLYDLKQSETGIISKINLPDSIKEKLNNLGLIINEKVIVLLKPTGNGPIKIKVMGVMIGIRKNVAKGIEVVKI